jgi:plasmid maintenance system antidote protein VapI
MPKKRIEPRGLNRKIAKILGLRENYISEVLNEKIQVSEKRAAEVAAAKIQARQENRNRHKTKGCEKSS